MRKISDGYANVVANLGTARDKASHSSYVDSILSPQQLLTMYRQSWLARAIVDYPAEDATRKWRYWRAEADQITKIERLEKKLGLQSKVQDAITAARLYGGAAIYINTGDQNHDEQISPGSEVKSLVVLTPNNLIPDQPSRDIFSDYYGLPEFYTLQSNGNPIKIHASRFVIFKGAHIPNDPSVYVGNGWGDSVILSALDPIRQTDSIMANIASLVFEAKIDVLKFDGFADLLANDGDSLAISRLQAQAAMKGINGALVIDAKDDYDNKQTSFASLPEVVSKFMDWVSGASRIPVTRLFGRAAAGLSGSGDGDERVYYDRIGHLQASEIGPAMSTLDDLIIEQALGTRPEEIYYEWSPLRQMTESERADIFSKTATAARAIGGANVGELVPLDALSDALVNALTEMGVLPGLESAVAEYGTLREQSGFVGDDE